MATTRATVIQISLFILVTSELNGGAKPEGAD
jgi:hypothetical protein